ncbi:MAG: CAP domain-containing protein [Desulfuromonadaceae bacterium]
MMHFALTFCLLLALAAPVAAVDHGLGAQVLKEINLARTDPHAYAGFIRQFRSQFRGKYYLQPGNTTRIQTTEGVAAVDEAIKYLSRLKPLPPLAWSNGLAAAAAELADEQERSGATGHNGRKSHGMRERIERHGEWSGTIGENIGYGPEGARNMVIQLIVDDGVPGRGHRVNTFRGDYRTAGVACRAHPRFGSMCVVDFAGGFRDR